MNRFLEIAAEPEQSQGTLHWSARHRRVLASVAQRAHDPNFGIVFSRGSGATLWDVEGRDYVDLTCGYSATNFGHGFAPFVAAASAQLTKLQHVTGAAHCLQIELAERLLNALGFGPRPHATADNPEAEASPGFDDYRVVFNTSGARAIETAWKAAVAYRPGKLIALAPGFHGKSIATAPLSAATGPIDAWIDPRAHLSWPADEYPYCERCPLGLRYPACRLVCADGLAEYLQKHADEISAVLVEPALGARGYIVPPAGFFRQLGDICSRHGIVMIADEIQTGLGRCGAMRLSAAQGWTPDVSVFGKSLGGGLVPISACIGRASILESLPQGSESETFAANAIACAIALEVLQQLTGRTAPAATADMLTADDQEALGSGDWIERGGQLGQALQQHSISSISSFFGSLAPRVGGFGASCTLEFSQPEVSLELAQRTAWTFVKECCQQGVLVHLSGPHRTRVVMLPAFTMSSSELHLAQQRLSAAASRHGTCIDG